MSSFNIMLKNLKYLFIQSGAKFAESANTNFKKS